MSLSLKQQRTKNEIVNAMIGLLNNQPLDQISISDICKAALIHHSTFYNYFHDKYDLLGSVLNTVCAPIINSVNQGNSFMTAVVQALSSNKRVLRNITDNNKSNSIYFDLINLMAGQLELAIQKENIVSPEDIVNKIRNSNNPTYNCYAFAGMIVGVFIRWNRDSESTSAEEFGKYFNQDLSTFIN